MSPNPGILHLRVLKVDDLPRRDLLRQKLDRGVQGLGGLRAAGWLHGWLQKAGWPSAPRSPWGP